MSSYVKATNFATKDTLPTGDSNKIVKGTEIDNELNAIAGAISSKSDIASPTFTGTPAAPTATAGSNTTQLANTAYVRGELATLIPTGVITLWSGAISAIPTGWTLCNGSNSTPDLRDRFVVGAGTTYAVGATGGANTVTLDSTMIPSHTHTVTTTGSTAASGDHTHTFSGTSSGQSATHSHSATSTDSGHQHSMATPGGQGSVNAGNNLVGQYIEGSQGAVKYTRVDTANITTSIGNASADHTHTYSGTTSAVSTTHTHTLTLSSTAASTGGGLAHENRPPYYALAWIMKT